LNIIPTTVVQAFAGGEILQVLFFSVLFGLALLQFGERGQGVVALIDDLTHGFFVVVSMIMKLAPIGAFGAMAFTIGQYGIGTLFQLGKLMAGFYATAILFVVLILGGIARLAGFSLWKFLKYIKEEILIVLGTSSSEAVLPRMMDKLERVGCTKSVVGLVIPTGYSFNLDGTCIYLTMGAIFIAQATGADVPIATQIGLLLFMLISSKGAAGVTGAGLVTLAASLAAFGDTIPVVGIALIVGIDRFMSEARALTNLIGNGVATMVIARWQGDLDTERFKAVLDDPDLVDMDSLLDQATDRATDHAVHPAPGLAPAREPALA
jgi:aerobic C4-dicarboxylate transport protein